MSDEEAPEARSNGFDIEASLMFVRRIESLQGEIDEIAAEAKEKQEPLRQDIAQVKREAMDAGVGKRELAAVVKKRRLERQAAGAGDKLDIEQRSNYLAMIEAFDRIADQMGDLGEAARDRFREAAA